MPYTPAELQARADEIAYRGVKRIQVGDRSHTFFSPKELREDARMAAADDLDAEYGGLMDVIFENPE